MSDNKETFPLWSESASKGDVLQSMIWTQALVGSLFGVVLAFRSDNAADITEALKRHEEEIDDFRKRIDKIAGIES